MATKSPLALVKETFGDKAKLVSAVEKLTGEDLWMARTNKSKGLAHVSNAKLLRLHATFAEVKEKFGTREKLIDAILDQQKRSKDSGLRQTLSTWPVPRLYDAYKAAAKRLAAGVPATRTPKPQANATADGMSKASAKKAATKAPKKAASTAAKKAAKKGTPKNRPRR
ncbi:MAG: hypothetical protein M3O46_10240 [Myxococcota bacterium]|nr:hypothetical protein [Myxococcota bacterium]